MGYYQKKGIQPNAKKMRDKEDMVAQGRARNQMGKAYEDFFEARKTEMCNTLVNQGYRLQDVQNFMSTYGWPDFNPDWAKHMN